MIIRKLNDGDIEDAIALEALVYEHISGKPLNAKNRFEHWFKTIDQELSVGMFDHDTLIGTAYARDINPGLGESRYCLDSLMIHPDYAGRKLGAQLFETMLAMVDCTTPNTSSFSYIGEDNSAMLKLNQKFGGKAGSNAHTYESDGRVYHQFTREPFAHILEPEGPRF